jgi:hypothetical protein
MLPDWTLSGFATVLKHIQPAGKSLTILLRVAFEGTAFPHRVGDSLAV